MDKYKEMQINIDKQLKDVVNQLKILDKKLAKLMREKS